jgi:hypothetical protein
LEACDPFANGPPEVSALLYARYKNSGLDADEDVDETILEISKEYQVSPRLVLNHLANRGLIKLPRELALIVTRQTIFFRIYSIICGSKRVVRGIGFIKKGTAIFALSFRHGKIYQPMCS